MEGQMEPKTEIYKRQADNTKKNNYRKNGGLLPLEGLLPEPVPLPLGPQVDGLPVGLVFPGHVHLEKEEQQVRRDRGLAEA